MSLVRVEGHQVDRHLYVVAVALLDVVRLFVELGERHGDVAVAAKHVASLVEVRQVVGIDGGEDGAEALSGGGQVSEVDLENFLLGHLME